MNPEQFPKNELDNQESNLPSEVQPSSLEEEKSVEKYILGTLQYTPQFYVKTQEYLSIKAYAPEAQQPAMEILRHISRLKPLANDPEGMKEISFQDEVHCLKEGKMLYNDRWQINFSVFVNEETYEFKSIREKPKKVSHIQDSVDVFTDLSKLKGATLRAGDWWFESDGNGWIPKTRDGKELSQLELKSLVPTLPTIE